MPYSCESFKRVDLMTFAKMDAGEKGRLIGEISKIEGDVVTIKTIEQQDVSVTKFAAGVTKFASQAAW